MRVRVNYFACLKPNIVCVRVCVCECVCVCVCVRVCVRKRGGVSVCVWQDVELLHEECANKRRLGRVCVRVCVCVCVHVCVCE